MKISGNPRILRETKKDMKPYNLKTDIAEENNLKNQHPEIVEQLKKAMQEFETEVTKNARPVGHVENPQYLVPSGVSETNKQ